MGIRNLIRYLVLDLIFGLFNLILGGVGYETHRGKNTSTLATFVFSSRLILSISSRTACFGRACNKPKKSSFILA